MQRQRIRTMKVNENKVSEMYLIKPKRLKLLRAKGQNSSGR